MIMELWVGDSFTLTMIMDWSPTIDKTLLLLVIIVFILHWFQLIHKQFRVESKHWQWEMCCLPKVLFFKMELEVGDPQPYVEFHGRSWRSLSRAVLENMSKVAHLRNEEVSSWKWIGNDLLTSRFRTEQKHCMVSTVINFGNTKGSFAHLCY